MARSVYGALWRALPGGFGAKLAGMFVLALGALAVLFLVVFPWVEPRLPWNDVTVNSPTIQQTGPSAPASSPTLTPSPSQHPSAAASVLPAG